MKFLKIAKKDFFSQIYSGQFYIFSIAFLSLIGLLFTNFLFSKEFLKMDYTFSIMSWLFVIWIPAMTMNSFSSEYLSGTIEILFSLPISKGKIVVEKFFGCLMILILLLGLTFIFPASMFLLGKPDLGLLISGYLGVFLIGMFYISIGIFASSLSSSSIVSFIVTFVFLFLFNVLSQLFDIILPSLLKIFNFIAPMFHFQSFISGEVYLSSILYFISLSSLFLFFSCLSLERKS